MIIFSDEVGSVALAVVNKLHDLKPEFDELRPKQTELRKFQLSTGEPLYPYIPHTSFTLPILPDQSTSNTSYHSKYSFVPFYSADTKTRRKCLNYMDKLWDELKGSLMYLNAVNNIVIAHTLPKSLITENALPDEVLEKISSTQKREYTLWLEEHRALMLRHSLFGN